MPTLYLIKTRAGNSWQLRKLSLSSTMFLLCCVPSLCHCSHLLPPNWQLVNNNNPLSNTVHSLLYLSTRATCYEHAPLCRSAFLKQRCVLENSWPARQGMRRPGMQINRTIIRLRQIKDKHFIGKKCGDERSSSENLCSV